MSVSTEGRPLLVAAEAVHTYYGQSHILRGVSLAVRAGECVGLMGRNGMGKTTLIRTLMGLVPAANGRVLIDGDDVTARPTFERSRRGLAYVPEGRGVFASLSVGEHLAVAERSRADGRREWTRVRVLELFPQLRERLDNSGQQLSGGEQQMLAIAVALLTNPRLLILDEATEGLAPLIRDDIWKTIRLIRESGIATIIVDKTVAEVTAIADRICVLVKGEIVFEDAPAQLLANPDLMHRHLGV